MKNIWTITFELHKWDWEKKRFKELKTVSLQKMKKRVKRVKRVKRAWEAFLQLKNASCK